MLAIAVPTKGFRINKTITIIFFRFAAGKSDKEILDNLLKNTRYDKRLLPPVDGEFNCFFRIVNWIGN